MLILDLNRDASHFIGKLQPKQSKQVIRKIQDLTKEPYPQDSRPLKDISGGWLRVDSGEFRIIYRVEGNTCYVLAVGKRNDDEVYRKLARKLR